MELKIDLAFEIFNLGVDYGQLIMEQERMSEEFFDAGVCYHTARKFGVPSSPYERRRVHSEKWINVKKQSYDNFLKLLVEIAKEKKGQGGRNGNHRRAED
jgi:hypothetical protein